MDSTVAIQVPIKGYSERIPSKNLKEVAGKPLFAHLLDRLRDEAPAEWFIVVDTDSDEIERAVRERYGDRFPIHRRPRWFGSNSANGNHLLTQFACAYPDYDIYIQAFVTAPRLTVNTLWRLVARVRLPDVDSATLVVPTLGWYWFKGTALNYNPDMPNGLPRSQDATVLRETAGAYAVKREALFRTCCRLPYPRAFIEVDRYEASDIDTPEDMEAMQ